MSHVKNRICDPTPQIVLDLRTDLGEGPFWDDATHTLVFVDSAAGTIFRWDPVADHLSRIEVGCQIGIAIPRHNGGFAVSSIDGLLGVAEDGTVGTIAPIERDLIGNRMNDAKCDRRGRLFSGTFAMAIKRGQGAFYRVDEDHSVTRIFDSVSVSNGLGWSPDETALYYIDTSSRGIDCFDYDADTGNVANRTRLIDIAREDGFPDGMTVDAQGHIWVALYMGGVVRRYAPDGMLVGEIRLPVSGVTSCCFGGADLGDLYITTARHGVAAEKLATEPGAGALFRCRPGVTGLASQRYAG